MISDNWEGCDLDLKTQSSWQEGRGVKRRQNAYLGALHTLTKELDSGFFLPAFFFRRFLSLESGNGKLQDSSLSGIGTSRGVPRDLKFRICRAVFAPLKNIAPTKCGSMAALWEVTHISPQTCLT